MESKLNAYEALPGFDRQPACLFLRNLLVHVLHMYAKRRSAWYRYTLIRNLSRFCSCTRYIHGKIFGTVQRRCSHDGVTMETSGLGWLTKLIRF